jgi:predicted metal-dependent phosphoesterase TrpH
MKADLHAHTHFSYDAVTSVKTFVKRYERAGIDCVAVSDHNNIDGALAVQSDAGFRVIISEEIRSTEGEIIGLFLRETVRAGLTPEDTVRAIREQSGLVLIPHPFIGFSALRTPALMRILPQVDVIEVFNAKTAFLDRAQKARRLAEEQHKPMSAASDAHTPWEIGLAYTEMPPFEGAGDFLIALGKGTIVGRRAFVGYAGFNVWAKLKWQLRLGRRVGP